MTNPLSRLSIFLSSLCVVHCLATPFILLLLPALSTFFSETVERILVLLVVPISMAGFLPTWLRHKNYRLFLLYLTSIGLILLSQFVLHSGHHQMDGALLSNFDWIRTVVMIIGALLLAWVVYRNNRHTHFCTHPHHNHHHQGPGHPTPHPHHQE